MQWVYIGSLLFSIAGLMVLDWRHRLAFWYDARRTVVTLAFTIMLFVLWDVIGIWFGIFHHGNSLYTLPYRIAPEFPIEELFFLFLLTYVTLILYRGLGKWRRIS